MIFYHELQNRERELGLLGLGEWGKYRIELTQHIS